MLELHQVCKTFNPGTVNEKAALNHLSLTLEEGDFVTVIGGNGAGKSTMLNAISGVWPVDKGAIRIDGVDVTELSEHRRAVYLGRVFQDPMVGTAGNMTIEENLALAARRGEKRTLRWGIKKSEREQFKELLRPLGLGLEDRLTAKVGLLSGGQRQALTLLMASLKKPKVLLLDEHTARAGPQDGGQGAGAVRPDCGGAQAHHPDGHPQYEGRHRPRQPAHHAGRRPGHSGHPGRGQKEADGARPAGPVYRGLRRGSGERPPAPGLILGKIAAPPECLRRRCFYSD